MRRFESPEDSSALRNPSRSLCVICALLAMALSSCSRSETPKTETTAQSSQTTTKKVVVSQIDLGRRVNADNSITDATDSFLPKDTIYASVIMTGAAPNTQVTARWATADGQIVSESTQMISVTDNTPTQFHAVKSEGWQPGRYKLEVVVDSVVIADRVFVVSGS